MADEHMHTPAGRPDFAGEAERLTADLPAGPETDRLAEAIRGNVEVFARLHRAEAARARPSAPDHLWERIAAEMRAESGDPAAPMKPLRFPVWRRVAAGLAAAAAVAAAVGLSLRRGEETPEPTPSGGSAVVNGEAKTPTVSPTVAAASTPTVADLLTRMTAAMRSRGVAGTVVVEQLSPRDATVPPVRREVRLAYAGPDKWQTQVGDTLRVRRGSVLAVRHDGARGPVGGEWTVVPAEADPSAGDPARWPADDVSLDPAALETLSRNYAVAVADGGEVAGRPTWRLDLSPRSVSRPSLRVWLDRDTGLRLRSERLDSGGEAVARAAFAEFRPVAPDEAERSLAAVPVSVGNPSSVAPSAVHEFDPAADRARLGFAPLSVRSDSLPGGFERRRAVLLGAATATPTLRTVFGDGLASLEVLQKVAPASAPNAPAAPGAAPQVKRHGRGWELSAVRHGVAVHVASEDLSVAELERVLDGLAR
jgi:hypothetical protein